MSPTDNENSQSGVASSTPVVESSSANASVRAVEKAVSQLEVARTYIERDLDQARGDMRDIRDRLKALEIKVEALPSKVWIGGVVLGGMAFLSAAVGIIAKLIGH